MRFTFFPVHVYIPELAFSKYRFGSELCVEQAESVLNLERGWGFFLSLKVKVSSLASWLGEQFVHSAWKLSDPPSGKESEPSPVLTFDLGSNCSILPLFNMKKHASHSPGPCIVNHRKLCEPVDLRITS